MSPGKGVPGQGAMISKSTLTLCCFQFQNVGRNKTKNKTMKLVIRSFIEIK